MGERIRAEIFFLICLVTDSGWFGIVGILEHFLICLVTDSGWFGIVGILEHVLIRFVTDSRCPILVSDSTILVYDPHNPVTDSDILVSDS